jgi:hypothetical protein
VVRAPDDEERRRPHARQRGAGEVRPPAPGDDGADVGGTGGGGDEGGGGAGAGAEEADRERGGGPAGEPVDRRDQAPGEQADVEAEMTGAPIGLLLGGGQQVEEQGRDARLVQRRRHPPVAGAVTARSAAVGEEHDPERPVRQREVAVERGVLEGDRDRGGGAGALDAHRGASAGSAA